MMKHLLPALLVLAASPALAAFDCNVFQTCNAGDCAPFEDGAMLVKETGDLWTVSIMGETYEGYETTTMEAGGEVSIVLPPQGPLSGLVSIYPNGDLLFTAHVPGEPSMAIVAYGLCAGDGG